MNVIFNEGEVNQVISSRVPFDTLSRMLTDKASREKIHFAQRKIGHNCTQWEIEGDGWKSFAKADPNTQSDVAEIYEMRKNRVLAILADKLPEEVKKAIFTVPSNDCIYFREDNNEDYEMALAAWGYKFPDQNSGGELSGFIKVREKQDVNIAFLWDGKKVPYVKFKIKGFNRTTDKTGIINSGKPYPVGSQIPIEKPDGTEETLVVEKGRADYFYDMTQYMTVEVSVFQDGQPASGRKCLISFLDRMENMVSDEYGRVSIKMPLECGPNCALKQPQPKCVVKCGVKSDEKMPSQADEVLHFKFEYTTPPAQMTVEIEAVQDNQPAAYQNCKINYNGNLLELTTDADGRATTTVEMPCSAPGKIIHPQPVCSVTCNNETQERTPHVDGETLNFKFNFVTPQPTVEVKVKVLQDGLPAADKVCSINFDSTLKDITTGPDGMAVLVLPLKCDSRIQLVKPQPVCVVKCNGETQEQTPAAENGQSLDYEFSFKTPKFVSIKLKDYGGYPLPDLDFVLTTKIKGALSLKTDENGVCMVPQEWFMKGEKINVKFDITDEYRKNHEVHDPMDRKSHFWNVFFKSKAKSQKE